MLFDQLIVVVFCGSFSYEFLDCLHWQHSGVEFCRIFINLDDFDLQHREVHRCLLDYAVFINLDDFDLHHREVVFIHKCLLDYAVLRCEMILTCRNTNTPLWKK